VQRHAFWGRLREAAPDGGPILVWRLGKTDFEGYEREGLFDLMVPALAAHFEDALQATRAASLQRASFVSARLVVDASGVSPSVLKCIKFFKVVIDIISSNYPEMFSYITVVRAPWIVDRLWPIIRPIVPRNSRSKIAFFGQNYAEGLRSHSGIELTLLPKSMGGDASDADVCETAPVPRGVVI